MATIDEMLKKAVEAKNGENMEKIQKEVKSLVDEIVNCESKAAEYKARAERCKQEIKNMQLPENFNVTLGE